MLCCQGTQGVVSKRPRLELDKRLEKFRDEVVQCLMHEILEEMNGRMTGVGMARLVDDVTYDVTEGLIEFQKSMISWEELHPFIRNQK